MPLCLPRIGRLLLARGLFLSGGLGLGAALSGELRVFGVRLSTGGRQRGERNKTEHTGKSFQQDFSRMAPAAVSREWLLKSGEWVVA